MRTREGSGINGQVKECVCEHTFDSRLFVRRRTCRSVAVSMAGFEKFNIDSVGAAHVVRSFGYCTAGCREARYLPPLVMGHQWNTICRWLLIDAEVLRKPRQARHGVPPIQQLLAAYSVRAAHITRCASASIPAFSTSYLCPQRSSCR
jgi:hypothetical protein